MTNKLDRSFLQKENLQLKITVETLRKLATKDELTGVNNRRAINEEMPRAIAETRREHGQLVVIMIDIDKFKELNDTYGHDWGDIILKNVADTFTATKRTEDFFARYGGEEFFLIFSESASSDLSHFHTERYRQAIAKINRSPQNDSSSLTVSFGAVIVSFTQENFHHPDPDIKPETILKMADNNLYYAKEHGRDQLKLTRLEARLFPS